jgi:hypothetical protein
MREVAGSNPGLDLHKQRDIELDKWPACFQVKLRSKTLLVLTQSKLNNL